MIDRTGTDMTDAFKTGAKKSWRHVLKQAERRREKIEGAILKSLRFAKEFPRGANVNFYDITGEDEVTGLTYERGVEDFTLACGTGTASMVAFLTECGEVRGRNVRVSVPGGVLIIDIERTSDGTVRPYLTGLTNIVAEGRATQIGRASCRERV